MQKLKVTSVGVELLEASGDMRWCLDFRDMNSPAIVVLGDTYGRKTTEGGGFVICPLYGRKSKAFMAASGTTNTAIISHLVPPFCPRLFFLFHPYCLVIHFFCSSMNFLTIAIFFRQKLPN